MQRVGRAVPASSGAARDIGNQPFVIWRNVAGSPNASLREIGEGFHETWNMRHRQHAVWRPSIIELREGVPNGGIVGMIGGNSGSDTLWHDTDPDLVARI